MMASCGGSHSEQSAKRICGAIAANKAKDASPLNVERCKLNVERSPERRARSDAPYLGDQPLLARHTSPLPPTAPREFMVLPAGEQTGTFGQGGRAVTKRIFVGPEAATALQEQLDAVRARSAHRPFFDFNHDDDRASGYPQRFFWRDGDRGGDVSSPKSGVYAEVEWTGSGSAAIAAKDYQAFSMVFFVDREDPAHVVCRPDADLNFGGLVNDPALKEISPLWAKQAATLSTIDPAISNTMKETTMTETTTAAATAAATAAPAADQPRSDAPVHTEPPAPEPLRAKDAELTALRNERTARRQADAKAAVSAAIARGALAPKDEPLQAKWQKWCEETPELIEALDRIPGDPALGGSITRSDSALTTRNSLTHNSLTATEGPKRIAQAYGALAAKSAGIRDTSFLGFKQKGELAREMAALYASDIRRNKEFFDMPLMAADYADPAGNLGTLSGTLVAQRTLELFKLQFPMINRVYTDFSDTPAQFKQTEDTRVIIVPAVQSYDTTLDTTGRPKGWDTVSTAQTKDVPITLDEHIGVPIVFDSNTLAGTVRRLFDEQAPAASYAFAKYFVEKIYKLMTPANFNAYAAVNGAYVPVAYATYAKGLGDFGRSSLVDIATIFNPNQVPIPDRTCLLNSQYYGQLSKDPSLITFYAGQRSPEIITDNELPKLGTFLPMEAPNLTNRNNTPNLVGFAMHKAGIIAKTRLSNDYTLALPGSSYGSVTTITEPDLGISVVLVQYVNHTGGYAEWRIQAMLGAAVGDNRGGLCLTSQ